LNMLNISGSGFPSSNQINQYKYLAKVIFLAHRLVIMLSHLIMTDPV